MPEARSGRHIGPAVEELSPRPFSKPPCFQPSGDLQDRQPSVPEPP